MSNEVKVIFGESWDGFEFAKVKKYKRKEGYRVDLIVRKWSGAYRTVESRKFLTLQEVVDYLSNIISRESVIEQLKKQGWIIEEKELSKEEETAILEEVEGMDEVIERLDENTTFEHYSDEMRDEWGE